ncbi:hypothetical protein [Kibdelosporangium phytohabitans]|uniref:DUF1877 domain-containing protein n=1 Tax=Kibdelosporangium phytohabitans TaxID=860235 RepID=A0A0N9I4Y8_9PSEU|nr:hypothetical protein [Kibdelosporangium phytohabitans]ALG09712.1 hypothetical protein AOZ06_24915 [Kibdelosporangium phytohabitans]MBE1468930.1 hypothetical protein [Kibdelosporangium phytohabitans]
MGIDIMCLTIDWESAVARYRETGLEFYWDAVQARNRRYEAAGLPLPIPPELEVLPGLPDADDPDLWCGTRAFHLVADFYTDALRPALPAELRRACEPVLPLFALCDEIPVPFDRQCLLTDSGLTKPPGNDPSLYTLRPRTVHKVLEVARSVPWSELYEFDDEVVPFDGYDVHMLTSFALQQLDRLEHAAQRDQGVVLILSV